MTRSELEKLWGETLRSDTQGTEQLDRLAQAVVDTFNGGEPRFRQHIKNRFNRVRERTGQDLDPENFDLATARSFVADEIGFTSWDELLAAARDRSEGSRTILFHYAVAAMDMGNFSGLESTVGGPASFHAQIVAWHEKGYFANEPETLAEIFAAACMLGHADTVEYLLEKGVDPYAGMRTGLAGFHYAASSGRLNVIKLLIKSNVPMEVKNMYGGTVFGQAMWSAVNEWTPDHAPIVEELVKAGAIVDDGYVEWWDEQSVPDAATKERIANILQRHAEFHDRVSKAQEDLSAAEASSSERAMADALKALGNVLRRAPFLRDAANEAYSKAADLYRELGLPLEEAWVKRHIGINHEYADRLENAEKYYDEALALYREHSTEDDLNYANAVRYPAVIKERLGKADESATLWEEAYGRYSNIHPDGLGEGVAEAAGWLTLLAIRRNDRAAAEKWFARAAEASTRSQDDDTHRFIDIVRAALEA